MLFWTIIAAACSLTGAIEICPSASPLLGLNHYIRIYSCLLQPAFPSASTSICASLGASAARSWCCTLSTRRHCIPPICYSSYLRPTLHWRCLAFLLWFFATPPLLSIPLFALFQPDVSTVIGSEATLAPALTILCCCPAVLIPPFLQRLWW